MPYLFDSSKMNDFLYILNGGPMENYIGASHFIPEYLERLDIDTVEVTDIKLVLGGNSDGIMDTCVFHLSPVTGEITFAEDYLQPRETIGVIQRPLFWPINKPFPQPPSENMWIEKAAAIIVEINKCVVQV
jgi:hypothetical protein